MHIEARNFIFRAKERFPEYFTEKCVLEVGSLNINGSPRDLFKDCEYIGVDKLAGKDVDVVGALHQCDFGDKSFDVIISTEALEHDEYLDLTVETMINHISATGIIIITTANINRKPHLENINSNGYYKNITRDMVGAWIEKYQLHGFIEEDSAHKDIRIIFSKDANVFNNHPELTDNNPFKLESIMEEFREIEAEVNKIKPYVLLAQPRRNLSETPAQKLDGNFGRQIDLLGYSFGFVNIGGETIDVARNYLFDAAIQADAKYLFFVGEDTVVPWDGFLKLHETANMYPNSMVIGVYFMKISSPMIMVKKDDYILPANVDPGQVFDVYSAGMDCALIPVKLLKEMKEKNPAVPFCCMSNQIDGLPFVGEDTFFYHRVRKMGFRVLVNTDVQCLHMDLATGKYTAHPSVNLNNYFTNIPITKPLTIEDKGFIDKRWHDRLPKQPSGGTHGN